MDSSAKKVGFLMKYIFFFVAIFYIGTSLAKELTYSYSEKDTKYRNSLVAEIESQLLKNKAVSEKDLCSNEQVILVYYCHVFKFNQALRFNQSVKNHIRLFVQLSDNDLIASTLSLSHIYLYGLGVDKDYEKSYNYTKKAFLSGDKAARSTMAFMLINGVGVQKDYEAAKKIYEEDAKNNDSNALFNLSVLLEKEGKTELARKLLLESSSLGYPVAMLYHGYSIMKDKSMEKEFSRLVQLSADAGYPPAQTLLGEKYKTGTHGFKMDLALAKQWYQKAAKANYPQAQFRLALLEINGGIKSSKHLSEVLSLFENSANSCLEDARRGLRTFYDIYSKAEGFEFLKDKKLPPKPADCNYYWNEGYGLSLN